MEEANRRLRRARLGRAASERVVARHIAPLEGVQRLRLLAPGFARLGLPGTDRTLAGLVAASRLPDLLLGPMFTALTRPGDGSPGTSRRRRRPCRAWSPASTPGRCSPTAASWAGPGGS